MEKSNRFTPFIAVPPGTTIKEELVARGIKQKEFAAIIGMQPTHFSELINGKRNITPAIAEKLESILDIPAKFWICLQAEYEYDCWILKHRGKEKQNEQVLVSIS